MKLKTNADTIEWNKDQINTRKAKLGNTKEDHNLSDREVEATKAEKSQLLFKTTLEIKEVELITCKVSI